LALVWIVLSLPQASCESHRPSAHVTLAEYAANLPAETPPPDTVAVYPAGLRVDSLGNHWLDLAITGREHEVRRVASYVAHGLRFTDHPNWYILIWARGGGTIPLSVASEAPRRATIQWATPESFELAAHDGRLSLLQPVPIRPGRALTPGREYSVELNRALDDELEASLQIDSEANIPCRRGDLVPGDERPARSSDRPSP